MDLYLNDYYPANDSLKRAHGSGPFKHLITRLSPEGLTIYIIKTPGGYIREWREERFIGTTPNLSYEEML